jgi:hypothetical protein
MLASEGDKKDNSKEQQQTNNSSNSSNISATLTVSLAPAQIVPDVGERGVAHHPRVKVRCVQQGQSLAAFTLAAAAAAATITTTTAAAAAAAVV